MARIRSVKPELCTSETMAQVSAEAERTFVRLWTHCDDEGRAKDHPRLLKASLFPLHDNVTADDIDRHLNELAEHGLVVRYVVDGVAFLAVPSWKEHQRPQKPQKSKLPSPEQVEPSPSGTSRVLVREPYGPVVEGSGGVVELVEVEVPPSISGQPQVLDPEPTLDVEQQTNRAVGVWSRLVAVAAGAGNPDAYAAAVGRAITDDQRASLRSLVASGMTPDDAAERLAAQTPAAVAMPAADETAEARERARRAEEATRARLAETAVVEVGDGRAGAAMARASLRPVPEAS